jgi:hypothetical protein
MLGGRQENFAPVFPHQHWTGVQGVDCVVNVRSFAILSKVFCHWLYKVKVDICKMVIKDKLICSLLYFYNIYKIWLVKWIITKLWEKVLCLVDYTNCLMKSITKHSFLAVCLWMVHCKAFLALCLWWYTAEGTLWVEIDPTYLQWICFPMNHFAKIIFSVCANLWKASVTLYRICMHFYTKDYDGTSFPGTFFYTVT